MLATCKLMIDNNVCIRILQPFGINDTIGVMIDLEEYTVSFAKNGTGPLLYFHLVLSIELCGYNEVDSK